MQLDFRVRWQSHILERLLKRRRVLAITTISSLFHVYGDVARCHAIYSLHSSSCERYAIYITSDEGGVLHPVVVQTSVNTTARLLLLKTKMTQVGVTSLLLILAIFCSAEWARVDGLLCFTPVDSSSSFLLPLSISSPILTGCRLDVYHTSTHDVALSHGSMRKWDYFKEFHTRPPLSVARHISFISGVVPS